MYVNGKSRLKLEDIVSSLNVKYFKSDIEYKIKITQRKCMWNCYLRASLALQTYKYLENILTSNIKSKLLKENVCEIVTGEQALLSRHINT